MLTITDTRTELPIVTINANDIPVGTLFTGTINGRNSVWFRTTYTVINLRNAGLSYTGLQDIVPNLIVNDYEVREAELILK